MAEYHVPRQPTTRVELLPGVGMVEVGAALAGAAVGYLLSRVAAHFGLGDFTIFGVGFFGAVGFYLVQGGQNSLWELLRRQRAFQNSPQRMLFQLGTGGGSPQAGTVGSVSLLRLRRAKQPVSRLPLSVQKWLPVATVSNGLVGRTDGTTVAVVRVEPVNLGLRSSTEQGRMLSLLHEALNALQQPAQILSLPRPMDLDNYVRSLEQRLLEVDPNRQRILRLYIHHVAGLVAGGEAKERRFFILLPTPSGRDAEREALQRAYDLTARLRQADLAAEVLGDQELLDLLYVWGHPNQAAFERPPAGPPSMTTLMEG